MSVELEKNIRSSNKLFTDEDKKVRDHDHAAVKNKQVLFIQIVIFVLN